MILRKLKDPFCEDGVTCDVLQKRIKWERNSGEREREREGGGGGGEPSGEKKRPTAGKFLFNSTMAVVNLLEATGSLATGKLKLSLHTQARVLSTDYNISLNIMVSAQHSCLCVQAKLEFA